MSQLSIGIDIRKSDLRRGVAGVRAELTAEQKKTNAAFDKAYAQLRAKKAAHERKMAQIGVKNAGLAAAADKRATAAQLANQKRLEAAKLKTASVIAAADKRAAAAQESIRRKQHAENHSAMMRRLRDEAAEWDKKSAIAKRGADKLAKSQSGSFRSGLGKIAGGAASTIGGLARSGLTAAGLGGSVLMAASVSKQIDVQKQAAALANQASTAGDPRGLKEIQASVLQQATEISSKGGPDREAVIAGLRSFQEISGNLQGAQDSIEKLAETADASDTDLSDLGRAAGMFSQQLQDNGLTGKELDDALDKVIRSGVDLSAAGSVEFKDVAQTAGQLASASGRVGKGNAAQNIIDAMALNQAAMLGGASSGDEAATSVMRFSSDLIANHDKIQKVAGINTRDKSGSLKPLTKLALDIVHATGGDMGKLVKLFDVRGLRVVEHLAKLERGDKTGKAARDSILKGEMSPEKRAELAANRREQADRKLSSAFDSLYAAVGTELVPVLIDNFIPALKDAAPSIVTATHALAGFISWVSAHKGESAALLVAGSIGESILKAQLGQVVAGNISGALKGSIAAAGIGLIVAAAIKAAIEEEQSKQDYTAAMAKIAAGDIEGGKEIAEKGIKRRADKGVLGNVIEAGGALVSGTLPEWLDSEENMQAVVRRAMTDQNTALQTAIDNINKSFAPNDKNPNFTPATGGPDVDKTINPLQRFVDSVNAAADVLASLKKNDPGFTPKGGRGTGAPISGLAQYGYR